MEVTAAQGADWSALAAGDRALGFKNLLGLSEKTAASITAFVMCFSVASRSPEANGVIQILSAISYGFLGPNSR